MLQSRVPSIFALSQVEVFYKEDIGAEISVVN